MTRGEAQTRRGNAADPQTRRHDSARRRAVARLAGIAVLLALASGPVGAASEGVPFVGNITDPNRCTINVLQDGTLGLSADGRVLSSKLTGGVGGVATVTSTRPYDVTADVVPFFTNFPSGGNLDTTFEARFSGRDIFRGRNFAERSGTNPVRTRGGVSITEVTVQLIATRIGSDFPAGNYTGEVIVRCE